MHLHLSETTIKTFLGTNIKKLIKNFSYIQYLSYLQFIFTSVIFTSVIHTSFTF